MREIQNRDGGEFEHAAKPNWTTSEGLFLAAWAILLLMSIFFQLRSRPLVEPDEGRNAETMLEMSLSGDFFIPRLNGLDFLDKPFLYYATGGLAMRVAGGDELAARLPGVLCTLALALAVGALARRGWGFRTAILAGFATVATPLPLIYTQIVIFDAMLALWICTAILALYLAVESEAGTESQAPGWPGAFRHWAAAAWLAMGLGVLTKGPVALLIPLAAVLPWAVWRRRSRRLVERLAPLALVAVLLPWLVAVLRADPRFLHYALVTETWSRLTSNELHRDAPTWYYLPVVLLGALPWSLVPFAGWRSLASAWRERDRQVRFLLLWFVVPFAIFSLLHSKRVHYILPLIPPLVLLSLWTWQRTPTGHRLPGVSAASAILAILGSALLAIGLGAAPEILNRVEGAPREVLGRFSATLGVAWIATAGLAALSARSLARATCALTLPGVALLLLSAPVAGSVSERRSSRALAQVIEAEAAGAEVVAVEAFPASLPFYLGRSLILVSADGSPLRSNYILRRFEPLARDASTLRSFDWYAAAIADCRAARVFLVPRTYDHARQQLGLAGRTGRDVGRGFLFYGPCNPEAADRSDVDD